MRENSRWDNEGLPAMLINGAIKKFSRMELGKIQSCAGGGRDYSLGDSVARVVAEIEKALKRISGQKNRITFE